MDLEKNNLPRISNASVNSAKDKCEDCGASTYHGRTSRRSQYVGITVASFDLELSVVCGFQKRSDSLR